MQQYWTLLVSSLFLFFASQVNANSYTLTLDDSKFDLVTYGLINQSLDFNTLSQPLVFNLTYWGDTPSVELNLAGKRVFIHSEDSSAQVTLKYGEAEKTILFNIQQNPATYTDKYMLDNLGVVSAKTPDVYKLANVILLLADSFHGANYRMHNRGRYVEDVIAWFEPFKDHPIFNALDKVDYYSFVENAAAYQFNGENIETSSVYSGFRAQDAVKDLKSLMSDFAKKSDFKTFYRQKQPYYKTLEERFLAITQAKTIWKWLENHFPARYQSYKVFFSPLGPGNHSARNFANGDFKESIMFISAPNRYENQSDSAKKQGIKLTRSFFTEIDHTYVNPVSDLYLSEINQALADLKIWYKGGGYNTPYLTFNEYMTWALFSLYTLDNYNKEDFQFTKQYIEAFMENRRGFSRFSEFNDAMIRLYKTREQDELVADMYPKIIRWFKSH